MGTAILVGRSPFAVVRLPNVVNQVVNPSCESHLGKVVNGRSHPPESCESRRTRSVGEGARHKAPRAPVDATEGTWIAGSAQCVGSVFFYGAALTAGEVLGGLVSSRDISWT